MCASYESKFSIRQLVDAFAYAGVEIGMAARACPIWSRTTRSPAGTLTAEIKPCG